MDNGSNKTRLKHKHLRRQRIRLGARKEHQRLGGWENGYVKPTGRIWKRRFNKKIRRSQLQDGNHHKKIGGWYEWC